jgi:RNA polymerase sigma-70 factor (ECF subfamily)
METDRQPGVDGAANPRSLERVEEAIWVLRARAGDSEAFAWLMAGHERPLLYYLRRFIAQPEAALDAHQEVWLDVFRGLGRLRAPEAFRAWLYRLAHAKAARFVRDDIRDAERREALHQSCEEAPAADAGNPEAIHRALAGLSPVHREVLTLHYLQDLTLNEIATATNCSVGTVKSRLHYARLALRESMERTSHE